MERMNNISQYEEIKRIVKGKLVDKTIKDDFESLSEPLFGEGNCFSSDEVRKRMYGMKYLIDVLEIERYFEKLYKKILSISDLHTPFQLPIETFKDYKEKVDILVLNGDLQDAQSVSKFPKKYRIPFDEEMIETRQYIIDLINYIKPKKVYINKGNHEDRLLKLLSDKLNDDLLRILPDSPLDLIINDGFKITNRRNKTETWYSPVKEIFNDIEIIYTRDWKCKIGKTIFAHPLAYSSGMLKTTEKAVNYFLREDRDFDTIVLAHTHKLGSFLQGNIYLYEQGCSCKTEELSYTDGYLTLPAQKGFIFVCQDKDGNLIHDKTKLIEIK
jgi:predicted phosphodiesterase